MRRQERKVASGGEESAGPAPATSVDRPGPPIARAPQLAPPKRRPRKLLAAAAVVLIVLGALAAYYFTQKASDRQSVIALAEDVSWGQQITPTDLIEVKINADPGLTPIPWSAAQGIVGQYAAVDLQAGGLLAKSAVTGQTVPPPGQALVGLSLKSGQIPSNGVSPGDKVQLIITPGNSNSAAGKRVTFDGTVYRLAARSAVTSPSNTVSVDVMVAAGSAADLGVAAAAGDVVLVLLPRK